MHQVCYAHRAATYMRAGPTRYRWEFRLRDGETAADFESLAAVHHMVRPWTGDLAPGELELVRVAEYTFRAQLANIWQARNVFLLGDAAHLTPPFIGQGMGAGLRDAANLSWKLAGVLSGDLHESVLDSYETERRAHARTAIRLAKLVGVSLTRGGRGGMLLRRVLAPRLDRVPGLRARVLDSETPGLVRSSLVLKPRLRPSLAGRLCPNARLEDGRRFDDVAASGFAVVLGRPPGQAERSRLDGLGATVVVAGSGTPLGAWLRRGRAQWALVRPDRTVMAAGHAPSGVLDVVPPFRP